ncbi:MAG: hypothetical protein U1U88_001276 [Lawsonella clevelandensis]
MAAFADLPIEGVVEGFFAVEGGVVVVEGGDAFFLDALTVFGEAFLDLRALVVGAAVLTPSMIPMRCPPSLGGES